MLKNKIIKYILFLTVFLITLTIIKSTHARNLSNKLKGKILLQVEQNGEAWYVNPADEQRYFMGRPDDAFNLMRQLGVGITNSDLSKIPVANSNLDGFDTDGDGLSDMIENSFRTDINKIDSDQDGYSDKNEILAGYNPLGNGMGTIDYTFANKHKGKIFLQVQANGEAWYVNPDDAKRYFLGRPTNAFEIMRNTGLGIKDADLAKITNNKKTFQQDCIDNDGDGYGNSTYGCKYSEIDCNDNDNMIHPNQDEFCNGNIDDNCNNQIDENCVCIKGDNKTCGSNVGQCVTGIQICNSYGQWGPCDNQVLPKTEICGNIIDDNCNNQVDENCAPVCTDTDNDGFAQEGDSCGVIDCDDNTFSTNPSATEICKNNIDDDCDGKIDIDIKNCSKFIANSPNPVFKGDIYHSWRHLIGDPSIIKEGNIYTMWFAAQNIAQGKSKISLATSSDGEIWDINSQIIMETGTVGSWDALNTETPTVIKNSDGTYEMWYSGTGIPPGDPITWDMLYKIGYATSPDGLVWEKHTSPVLDIDFNDLTIWDALAAADPSVLKEGGTYKMWYSGGTYQNDKLITQIGYATSLDGKNWQRHRQNPVLALGAAGSFDSLFVGQPSVSHDGEKYIMVYTGTNKKHEVNDAIGDIGIAFSIDGINWERSNKPIIQRSTNPDDWDSTGLWGATGTMDGDIYKIWHTGIRVIGEDISTGFGYTKSQ